MTERRSGPPPSELPPEAYENGELSWEFFEQHPDKIISRALYNFHNVFRGSRMRQLFEDSIQTIQKRGKKLDPIDVADRKFVSAVEQAAGDAKIDLEEVKVKLERVNRLFDQMVDEERVAGLDELLDEVRQQIMPIYKILRERGWSHTRIVTGLE